MNITVRVQNFKSLEDVTIKLSPTVFLFGPNGAGKSSILKALLFLERNLFPLNLYEKTIYKVREDIDLGDFSELVKDNDLSKEILYTIKIELNNEFYGDSSGSNSDLPCSEEDKLNCVLIIGFKFETNGYNLSRFNVINKLNNTHLSIQRNTDVNWSRIIRNAKQNEDKSYWEEYQYKMFAKRRMITGVSINERPTAYSTKLNIELSDGIKTKSLEGNIPLPYVFPDIFNPHFLSDIKQRKERKERQADYDELAWDALDSDAYRKDLAVKLDFIKIDLPTILYENLHSLHLRSTREIPYSQYFYNAENYAAYYSIPRLIELSKSIGINYQSEISRLLSSLSLAKSLEIEMDSNMISLIVIGLNGERYNICNASSGLIQSLPIIHYLAVAILNQKKKVENEKEFPSIKESYYESVSKSNLLIEQPELHLHPKLQTKLIEQIVSRNRSSRMIFETHSEHMFRKIQVMIAKGEITNKDISVYFIDKGKCLEIQISEKGQFEQDWPDGFFDDSANLTFELFDAIIKRNN